MGSKHWPEKPLLSTVVLWYWSPTHAHKRTNEGIDVIIDDVGFQAWYLDQA